MAGCWIAGVCVFVAGCATVITPEKGSAEAMEAQRRAFGKAAIERCRRKEPATTPEWVNLIPDRVADILIEKNFYKQGEVWGLAKRDPYQELEYEEAGSLTFLSMVGRFNLWDRVPVLDKHAKQKALGFWQSWQDPQTGLFKDPRDPGRLVNEKYVVILIDQFGGEPLYPRKKSVQALAKDSSGMFDTSIFLKRTKDDPDWARGGWGVGSHTGFMAVEIFRAINDGHTELIADLEKGIEQILSHQDPTSGLWGPPTGDLTNRIGGTLKVVSRLYFHIGMKVPHTKALADSLIRHQQNGDWLRYGTNFCLPQNVAILVGYCLEVCDHRRAELLGVLDSLAEDYRLWVNPDGSLLTRRGDRSSVGIENVHIQALGIIGAYLHWTDCRLSNAFESYGRGFGYRYRCVLQKEGRVKVVDTTNSGICSPPILR